MRTPVAPSESPSCHRYELGSVVFSLFSRATHKTRFHARLGTCGHNDTTTLLPVHEPTGLLVSDSLLHMVLVRREWAGLGRSLGWYGLSSHVWGQVSDMTIPCVFQSPESMGVSGILRGKSPIQSRSTGPFPSLLSPRGACTGPRF